LRRWSGRRELTTVQHQRNDRNFAKQTRERTHVEWIYLEAAVALALLIAIVWWTASARRKPRDDE